MMSVHSKLKATGQPVKAAMGQQAKHVTRIHAFQQEISFYLPQPSDPVQKTIRTTKKFLDQDMLAEVGAQLAEEATVVDVGANIGNTALFFAKVVGAKVLSFETNPDACAALEASLALNEIEQQVELNKIALGRGDAGPSLDEVLGERHVDLIKIDADGAESAVLRGAERTLKRCKPVLLCKAGNLDVLAEIETTLRPCGYQKVTSFNETPSFLFEYGLEPSSEGARYTENLLANVRGKLPKTTGIYAGLVTEPGNETALRTSVMSLLPQVDGVFVCLNGFSEVPPFLTKLEQVTCHLDPEGTMQGDAGKFWGLGQVEDAIYLSCSDDIQYPQDYVRRMTEELADCGGRSVMCVQGSLLMHPLADFDTKGARSDFDLAAALIRRRQVHVPATVTCAFHSAAVDARCATIAASTSTESWFASCIASQHVQTFAVPRKANWLQKLTVSEPTTQICKASEAACETEASCPDGHMLQTLSILNTNPEAPVVGLALEKDSNVLSALKELPAIGRDPVVLIMCDAVTDDLRAKVAQSSYNWEIHLVPRGEPASAAVQSMAAARLANISFWKVEKRRLVRDESVNGLQDWLGACK